MESRGISPASARLLHAAVVEVHVEVVQVVVVVVVTVTTVANRDICLVTAPRLDLVVVAVAEAATAHATTVERLDISHANVPTNWMGDVRTVLRTRGSATTVTELVTFHVIAPKRDVEMTEVTSSVTSATRWDISPVTVRMLGLVTASAAEEAAAAAATCAATIAMRSATSLATALRRCPARRAGVVPECADGQSGRLKEQSFG